MEVYDWLCRSMEYNAELYEDLWKFVEVYVGLY